MRGVFFHYRCVGTFGFVFGLIMAVTRPAPGCSEDWDMGQAPRYKWF